MNRYIFKTNLHKASVKVNINSYMIGGLFFVLTMIWSFNPERFNPIITNQILLAIPLLFSASLAYIKVSEHDESKIWDTFGWITNTLGNTFVFNVIGLMAATINGRPAALMFFLSFIFIMLIYTIANITENQNLFPQRLFKFAFLVAVLFLGGILPLYIITG